MSTPAHEPPPRFPLAARALRSPAAVAPAAGGRTARAAAGASAATATGRARVALARRHNWALYVFLLLLPLQNIQTGYLPNLGGGINFLNVMFALSLAGALLVGGRLAPGEAVNRWALAYAAYAVVSLLVSLQTLGRTGSQLNILRDQLMGLSVLYLVQLSVRDWHGVRLAVLATLVPLPYIAKVTWVQHVSVSSWHYSDNLRIKGTFALLGANEFAAFCVTVAAVLLALLLASRASWRWRAMFAGGIACMVLGVVYAYSRTAYIALPLALVTVVLAWRGRWKLLLPMLLLAMVLPALLPPSVVERFDSTTVQGEEIDESTANRYVYWDLAWDTFTAHPLTGTGLNTFVHLNPAGMDTHNLYLRTLSEGGIAGAAVLLGLLLAVLFAARRAIARARAGTWAYALGLGVLGAWVGMACGNLFGDRFTYYPVIAYFWVYVALMLKAPHLPPEDTR